VTPIDGGSGERKAGTLAALKAWAKKPAKPKRVESAKPKAKKR
jgi:hypothetical protein